MIPILREADTDRAKIFAREDPVDSVAEPVRAILADVKAHGDAALKKYTQEFDGVEIATVEVGAGALEEGFRAADPTLVDILYRLPSGSPPSTSTRCATAFWSTTRRASSWARRWSPWPGWGCTSPGARRPIPPAS